MGKAAGNPALEVWDLVRDVVAVHRPFSFQCEVVVVGGEACEAQ
jgi:hypothetical protein